MIKGFYFNYPAKEGYRHVGPGHLCAKDSIVVKGEYHGEASFKKSLMPFFEKIFEHCGIQRPDHLPQE